MGRYATRQGQDRRYNYHCSHIFSMICANFVFVTTLVMVALIVHLFEFVEIRVFSLATFMLKLYGTVTLSFFLAE